MQLRLRLSLNHERATFVCVLMLPSGIIKWIHSCHGHSATAWMHLPWLFNQRRCISVAVMLPCISYKWALNENKNNDEKWIWTVQSDSFIHRCSVAGARNSLNVVDILKMGMIKRPSLSRENAKWGVERPMWLMYTVLIRQECRKCQRLVAFNTMNWFAPHLANIIPTTKKSGYENERTQEKNAKQTRVWAGDD